ncbi:hypothetical protein [Oceanobacillus sojae]|uniref:hypothetical protein n=1 Tax=Oceanobacillus sojae TaxID=582851 RepID=UPI0009884988|nr:hypothetical protein [Oceanobacillus sojae]MCT1903038.1 hypothetical protein [Oceanobacillus sojae]
MDDANFIRQGLHLQGLPFCETDIPYILQIRCTMTLSQNALSAFPYLNMETPITIVDKELLT